MLKTEVNAKSDGARLRRRVEVGTKTNITVADQVVSVYFRVPAFVLGKGEQVLPGKSIPRKF